MSPRLASAIDSANPMQGGLSEHALMLRAFRLMCLVSAGLLPVFGWFYHYSGVAVVDPWSVRIVSSAVLVVWMVLTYTSPWFRLRVRHAYRAFVYCATVYFGWLVYANGFTADYTAGYLFVFLMSALTHSLAEARPAPFARYLIFSTLVAGSAILTVPDPEIAAPTFLLIVVALSGLMYVSVAARMATNDALLESRERLASAEALAGAGSWDLDLMTGKRRWSDGTHRLFGTDPGADPPSLLDVVHPEDRAEATEHHGRIVRSGGTADYTFRALSPTGAPLVLRSVSQAERGRSGVVERLYGALLDVTVQVAREAELRDARDRAEASDRAKSAFLANMSHEIRTPLTAIIGYAQLLGEETGAEHADLVRPIETGGLRLLDTLNSVLDLARMESSAATAPRVAVDAGAEARSVVEMLRGRAEAQGLTLSAEVGDGIPFVLADRGGLSRILANLVSNAVKFTASGHVTVCARLDGERVALSVSDTGCGMDAAFLQTLYEPFQQASTGWARSHEGTGLGLTITRRLVEDMGGEIAVESAPGRGTTFTVLLDIAPEPSASAHAEARTPTGRERAAA